MEKNFFYTIDKVTYKDLGYTRYIAVNGWCYSKDGNPVTYSAMLNNKNVEINVAKVQRSDVYRDKKSILKSDLIGFRVKVDCIDTKVDSFELIVSDNINNETLLKLDAKDIKKARNTDEIEFNLDSVEMNVDKGLTTVQGWVYSENGESVNIEVLDKDSNSVESHLRSFARQDLVQYHLVKPDNRDAGFQIRFEGDSTNKYYLRFSTKDFERKVEIVQRNRTTLGLLKSYITHLNARSIHNAMNYLRKNGVKKFVQRFKQGVNVDEYQTWFLKQRVTAEELAKQAKVQFEYSPKISIAVATFNTKEEYLKEMIDTVVNQSYSNWELCIADGSTTDAVEKYIEAHYADYADKIKFKRLDQNYGISGNTNKAMEMADGDYLAVYDHDDVLELDCFYEVVKALQEFRYDTLYTDEDKLNDQYKVFIEPNLKPDYSEDLMRSHNYITHIFFVNRRIYEQVGGYRSEYDGSQDYDYIFRCIEKANGVYHIPRVLYHWRMHPQSTAMDPESKLYCYTAGQKAIESHYKRIGLEGARVELLPKPYYGFYHTIYSTEPNPLVSILIPNYNQKDTLKTCIDSLYNVNTYKNFEVVIVENNSTEKDIFEYYEQLKQEHDNVTIVTYEGSFNYSKINNFGVKYTKGEYVLFLNNDTEVIEPTAIAEMLGCCLRKEVGAVGAKLLYEDNTIQHAGVVVGFNGYAAHVFNGIDKDDPGFLMRPRINCNYSACTAACLMVKKNVFEEVNGFDEQFVVACNDIDLCLKIREKDYLIVYNAFALWYHYESKSRGYEDTPEKQARFTAEMKKFQAKWPDILKNGDPYYNKNWNLELGPFKLS